MISPSYNIGKREMLWSHTFKFQHTWILLKKD